MVTKNLKIKNSKSEYRNPKGYQKCEILIFPKEEFRISDFVLRISVFENMDEEMNDL